MMAMPTYEVERYELYVQRYRIEASTEADAIVRVYRGEAEAIEGSLTFVEVGNDHGMSISEALALGQVLWETGWIDTADLVIPSIRSIRQVE